MKIHGEYRYYRDYYLVTICKAYWPNGPVTCCCMGKSRKVTVPTDHPVDSTVQLVEISRVTPHLLSDSPNEIWQDHSSKNLKKIYPYPGP